MFARLRQPSRSERLRNFLWPRIGWRRWLLYVRLRLIRIKGGPHSIAGGLAFGIAFSFTPLVGLHVLLAIIASRLLKFNMLAAVIGTVIGNPVTLPFIWWWIFKIGEAIRGQQHPVKIDALTQQGLLDSVVHLFNNFGTIFFPMLLGGMVLFVPLWFLSYFLLKKLLTRWQHRLASSTSPTRKHPPS